MAPFGDETLGAVVDPPSADNAPSGSRHISAPTNLHSACKAVPLVRLDGLPAHREVRVGA